MPLSTHSAMLGDIFYHYNLGQGAAGTWWVEARDAAKHITMHRTAPYSKDYPPLNVSRAEVENPYFRLRIATLYTLT